MRLAACSAGPFRSAGLDGVGALEELLFQAPKARVPHALRVAAGQRGVAARSARQNTASSSPRANLYNDCAAENDCARPGCKFIQDTRAADLLCQGNLLGRGHEKGLVRHLGHRALHVREHSFFALKLEGLVRVRRRLRGRRPRAPGCEAVGRAAGQRPTRASAPLPGRLSL